MIAADVWEEVWNRLNGCFADLAGVVGAQNSKLWWRSGHHANSDLPFRAWASFSRQGIPGEEDLVISVDFKKIEHGLEVTTDIARGNGVILAEAPVEWIALFTDTGSLGSSIVAVQRACEDFLRGQEAVLLGELS